MALLELVLHVVKLQTIWVLVGAVAKLETIIWAHVVVKSLPNYVRMCGQEFVLGTDVC